jgi:hypothetical protein
MITGVSVMSISGIDVELDVSTANASRGQIEAWAQLWDYLLAGTSASDALDSGGPAPDTSGGTVRLVSDGHDAQEGSS